MIVGMNEGLPAGFAMARLKQHERSSLPRHMLPRLAGRIRDGAIETSAATRSGDPDGKRLAGRIRDGAIETKNGCAVGRLLNAGLPAGFAMARLKLLNG